MLSWWRQHRGSERTGFRSWNQSFVSQLHLKSSEEVLDKFSCGAKKQPQEVWNMLDLSRTWMSVLWWRESLSGMCGFRQWVTCITTNATPCLCLMHQIILEYVKLPLWRSQDVTWHYCLCKAQLCRIGGAVSDGSTGSVPAVNQRLCKYLVFTTECVWIAESLYFYWICQNRFIVTVSIFVGSDERNKMFFHEKCLQSDFNHSTP